MEYKKEFKEGAGDELEAYKEIDALLARAQAGDSEAMGDLILRLDPLIKKQARHYFGKADEDLLQMGRLRAFELIQAFDPDFTEVRFLGYMSRFLGCYFWDLKKYEIRRASLSPVDADDEELARKAIYEDEGFLEVELEDLLQGLTAQEACVVRLNILMNNSLQEVAEMMDLSRDQVRYLKKKALDRLRALY